MNLLYCIQSCSTLEMIRGKHYLANCNQACAVIAGDKIIDVKLYCNHDWRMKLRPRFILLSYEPAIVDNIS